MKIKRTRYIVMRNNRTEVWCEVSKHFHFRKIDEVDGVSIKTYKSKARAKASCSSWDRNFEIVKITEL